MWSGGHPMGPSWVGVLMYCYYIDRYPSQTPLGDPLTSIFFPVDVFDYILITYKEIKKLSQFLAYFFREIPFLTPFIKWQVLHKVYMPGAAWIFMQCHLWKYIYKWYAYTKILPKFNKILSTFTEIKSHYYV